MKPFFLLLLISAYSSMFLFGSVIEKVRKFADKVSLDSDNLKHLMEPLLQAHKSVTESTNSQSMFSQMAIGFSTLKKTSEETEYMLFIETLLNHLNNICLASLRKLKSGELSDVERDTVISSIYSLALETKHFSFYKCISVTIPDRNIVIYFKTLYAFNQNYSRKKFFSFAKLAAFCESEISQDLLYSFLLDYVTKYRLSTDIKFNPNTKNLSTFNFFITDFAGKATDFSNGTSQMSLIIKSLLNGPATLFAANLVNASINQEALIPIIEQEFYKFKLINLLIETDSVDFTIEKLHLEATNKHVKTFLTQLSTWKNTRSEINSLIDPDLELFDFMIQAKDFMIKDILALYKYSKINIEFTDKCVQILHNRVMDIIRQLEIDSDIEHLHSAFQVLSLIPYLDFPFLYGADYSRLFDFVIEHSEIIEALPDGFIRIPICLSFTPITHEILLKYFTLVSMYSDDPAGPFLNAIQIAIKARHFDDEKFFDAVEACVYFSLLHEIDFCTIVPSILEDILNLKKYALAERLKLLFNLHRMMSKSVAEFTKQILDSSLFDAKNEMAPGICKLTVI